MLNQSGIYEILNTVNGKRYIGQAKNFASRWAIHLSLLRKGTHHSRHLQHAWNKYGEGVFGFKIILVCAKTKQILCFYEQQFLDKIKPEYNVSPTAGTSLGIKRTPIARKRMSDAAKKRVATPETRRHMSEAQRNIVRSPEWIAERYISIRGKPLTFGHKSKIAESNRGQKRSLETKAKISAVQLGRKQPPRSPEWCAKISAATKGKKKKPLSPEHKAVLSVLMTAAHASKRAAGQPWRKQVQ